MKIELNYYALIFYTIPIFEWYSINLYILLLFSIIRSSLLEIRSIEITFNISIMIQQLLVFIFRIVCKKKKKKERNRFFRNFAIGKFTDGNGIKATAIN